ncbi:TIGR03067 domain-containing protein [Terricaulis sp.]|uniref:TIGR03067 domain-containing protein n=1 Tax=Terricaulis sp. TaxID=2768686 RepID=UPI003783ECA6
MSDLTKLQGAWRVVSLEMNGAGMPVPPAARVVIKGARLQSLGMGAVYEGDMTLNEAARTFALTFSAGPEGGRVNHALYAIEGDQLTLCINVMGGPAPAAFATRPGDGLALETLVREG